MDAGQKADELAREIGALLHVHNGGDVIILDLRALNLWTDFFIVATVTSSTHMGGLERHIKDFLNEREIDILHANLKRSRDDDWELIDIGNMVIHLMSAPARSFYELEHLWSDAVQIRIN